MSNYKTEPNELIHPTNAEWHSYGGLTKREYFAGLAMQGLIAGYDIHNHGLDNEYVSRTAVRAADKLIEALNEESNEKP